MSFRGKAIGAVRRVGSIYAWSVLGDWREVRENATRLRDRLQAMRNRRYRDEQFDDAVARLGLSDEKLNRRRGQLSGLSVLYGSIVIVALLFLCATPLSDHPINHAVMSIGVMIVAGSKFLAAKFRVAQIDAGRLFGFNEWLFGREEVQR